MKQPVLVDGLDNVAMVEGVMRFDLMTMLAMQEEGKPPQMTEALSVAMSVHGFIRLYDQLNQIMRRLESQGVIQRREKDKQDIVQS